MGKNHEVGSANQGEGAEPWHRKIKPRSKNKGGIGWKTGRVGGRVTKCYNFALHFTDVQPDVHTDVYLSLKPMSCYLSLIPGILLDFDQTGTDYDQSSQASCVMDKNLKSISKG